MTRAVAADALARWLEDSRAWCEATLEAELPPADAEPARLHEAMRYAVFGGGKRLRPALVRLLCEHLGGADDAARLPAAALELVHSYSLVHDDLPAMDDDELRRGRPTCHVVYGEALGILVGDALLTLAFELVARAEPRCAARAARALAAAAGSRGMVGGQVLDLASSEPDAGPPTRASVHGIHALKTAALFGAAAELGALCAGAADDTAARAADFGRRLGLAFQATDDVLDVTGSAATLGKTPGKDAALERGTLVAALGLAAARAEARRLADLARAGARELEGACGPRLEALVELVRAREA